jgi:hypothetical protein
MNWKQFPTPAALAASSPGERPAAELQAPVLAHVDYAELYDRQGRPQICVTFDSSEQCPAALIYYSPAGQSTLSSTGLEPPVYQRTTLTFLPAPSDNSGLTLLTFWRQPPTPAELLRLMQDGVTDSQPEMSLRYIQWFKRRQPTWRNPPWLDALRPQLEPPPGILRNAWPLCLVEALPDQTIRAKDCILSFQGLAGFGLDRDGSYGYWRLSWDAPLTLRFDLPGPSLPRKAQLLVRAQADGVFPWNGSPALDVTVNGWGMSAATAPASRLLIMQPIAIDVSQNLQLGINTIKISVGAFSNVGWRVRQIEIWAE